jgi:enamine deaminase RidA (YjgF/YER057c/UK114 family)
LSGQVPADPEAGIQDQTQSTLDRIDVILQDIGSNRENIISATIYLRDIANHFALMNETWNSWIPTGHAPARACVQAEMARPALLVEISIVAAVP